MSHAGRLELGGADVRGGHVRVAELHLFVRHDVVQMFGDAFHQPDVRLGLGEVLQPVALGRRDQRLEDHQQQQQGRHANGPRAVDGLNAAGHGGRRCGGLARHKHGTKTEREHTRRDATHRRTGFRTRVDRRSPLTDARHDGRVHRRRTEREWRRERRFQITEND